MKRWRFCIQLFTVKNFLCHWLKLFLFTIFVWLGSSELNLFIIYNFTFFRLVLSNTTFLWRQPPSTTSGCTNCVTSISSTSSRSSIKEAPTRFVENKKTRSSLHIKGIEQPFRWEKARPFQYPDNYNINNKAYKLYYRLS